MLICGRCGRALTVRYQGNGGLYPQYLCSARRRDGLATTDCMSMRSDLLDNAIGEAVLTALQPAELKLAVTALNELEQRDRAIMRQWHMRIERAEYEVALAERRYQECDPANRLVAGTLERRWNDAMIRLEAIKTEANQFQSQKARVATSEQEGPGPRAGAQSAVSLARANDISEGSQAHVATTHPGHHGRESICRETSRAAHPLAGQRVY
jgi:hypothetical protein